MDLKNLEKESNYGRNQIIDKTNNSANYRFLNKKIYDQKTIYNGEIENVTLKGRGNLTNEILDGKKCLVINTNTDIEGVIPRPSTEINIKLDDIDASSYNRVSINVYIEATGYYNFYVHFLFGNIGYQTNHAPSIEPNKWVQVNFECAHIKRDKLENIKITPFLMGTPPEALPDIKFYLSDITLEKVDIDHDHGWDLENNISYCHSGYFSNSKKIAICQNNKSNKFTLINTKTNENYEFDCKKEKHEIGEFTILDFSSISKEGTYILQIDERKTNEFVISDNCFNSAIIKSLHFLKNLRCGEDVVGVHSACHLNCKTVHPETGKTVPNFGGWHDAGDVSQFEIPTAEMAHALCDLSETFKDNKEYNERILEEAKVGLSWLLRTRFNDGYRAMAILYKIHRKNDVDPNIEDLKNVAERGSFENFLSSASLASGARVFKDVDPVFSTWCKRSAIEDFEFAKYEYENDIYTVRWGKPIVSQTLGAAITSAIELYKITNDKKYIEISKIWAKDVMACQEKTDIALIKGFFYEDKEHKYILQYEHRGHEQSPIQGLCYLHKYMEDSPLKDEIYNSIMLYRDFCIDSIKYSSPYNLLPGGIYKKELVNLEHYTIPSWVKNGKENLLIQAETGTKLKNGYILRVMPIAVQRRGFHATLLSKTKGLSIIAKQFDDKKAKEICINQIEWILGKNPFSTSTMYGEGYNYHNLYVAFSTQIVGALPVGIENYENLDLPYWPTITNAVFKEIWGHTTGKFLWVLADIL